MNHFWVISLLNIKQMQRGDTELVSGYWQTHCSLHCIELSHTYVTIATHSGPAVFTDGTGITQSHPDLTSLPLRSLIHRSLKPDRKIRVGVIRVPPERQRPKLTGIIIFACAGKWKIRAGERNCVCSLKETPNCHLGEYTAITEAELPREMRYSCEKIQRGRLSTPINSINS